MSKVITKADIACALGAALIDTIEQPDNTLQGYDVAVIKHAFCDALLAATPKKDRASVQYVFADPELKAVYLAKACEHMKRKFRILRKLSPQRAAIASLGVEQILQAA